MQICQPEFQRNIMLKKKKKHLNNQTAAAAAAAKLLHSCPTVQPHRQQPTRLLRPWDLPDKSTRVGCHCLPHFPGGLVVKNCLTMQETQV